MSKTAEKQERKTPATPIHKDTISPKRDLRVAVYMRVATYEQLNAGATEITGKENTKHEHNSRENNN